MWDEGRGWREGGEWGMHDGMGWGGWLFMTLLLLLLVALVVMVALALFRGWSSGGGGSARSGQGHGRSAAEALLDERFARGEIDEDEYRRRREALRSG